MKKIAFFVEGQTEQIFVNRLVRYLLGPKCTTIVQKKVKGGAKVPKEEITIHRSETTTPVYEVMIVNCGSDNRVKSEMLENFDNLNRNGYKHIVGMRDLYPIPIDELDKLQKGLAFLPLSLKRMPLDFDIVLAVREIESWFLAEGAFLQKMNKVITEEFLLRKIGYNPAKVNYRSIEHPAAELNRILQLVGLSYAKKYTQARKVVYSLDMRIVMHMLRKKIKELDLLISYLEKIRDE